VALRVFVVQDCLGGFVLLFIFRRASSQSCCGLVRDLLVPGGVKVHAQASLTARESSIGKCPLADRAQ